MVDDQPAPHEPVPTLAECRRAAQSVRRADGGRGALRVLRPRSDFAVSRRHLPLPLLLRLRAQQGRLVWLSAGAFAVLDPPVATAPSAQDEDDRDPLALAARSGARTGGRALRVLDEHWEGVAALGPAVGMVLLATAAAVVARARPETTAVLREPVLVLGVLALVNVAAVMSVFVLSSGYRLVVTGRRRRREAAVARVSQDYWSVDLLHGEDPGAGAPLLDACRHRAAGGALGSEAGRLIVPLLAVTSRRLRTSVRAMASARVLSDRPPVLVLGGDGPLSAPRGRGRLAWRDLGFLLGGTAVLLVVLAWVLAPLEADLCAPTGCGRGEPTTYGDMLYWLVTRVVSGGDPNGLGPSSWQNRVIGTLLSFYGLYLLIWIFGLVVEGEIQESLSSADDLVARFNQGLAAPVPAHPPAPTSTRRRWALRLSRALESWSTREPPPRQQGPDGGAGPR